MPCVLCRGQHVHMPWVTWVMLWVYGVGTPSSAIWCGLPYAVDNRCPHHIQPVVHGIYMVWVHAVGTHELCRCKNNDFYISVNDFTLHDNDFLPMILCALKTMIFMSLPTILHFVTMIFYQ